MLLKDDFRKQIGEISYNVYPLSADKFEVILDGRFRLVFSECDGVDLYVLTNNMSEFHVGRNLIDEQFLTVEDMIGAYYSELCCYC